MICAVLVAEAFHKSVHCREQGLGDALLLEQHQSRPALSLCSLNRPWTAAALAISSSSQNAETRVAHVNFTCTFLLVSAMLAGTSASIFQIPLMCILYTEMLRAGLCITRNMKRLPERQTWSEKERQPSRPLRPMDMRNGESLWTNKRHHIPQTTLDRRIQYKRRPFCATAMDLFGDKPLTRCLVSHLPSPSNRTPHGHLRFGAAAQGKYIRGSLAHISVRIISTSSTNTRHKHK